MNDPHTATELISPEPGNPDSGDPLITPVTGNNCDVSGNEEHAPAIDPLRGLPRGEDEGAEANHRVDQALQLLGSLYGGADRGTVTLCRFNPSTIEFFDLADPTAIERMAIQAVDCSDQTDVYFGINAIDHPLEHGERGRASAVLVVTCFALDCDITPGDPAKPQSMRELVEFLATLPLLPSIVVSSGSGGHVYYLFREPYLIETEDERAEIGALAKGWEQFIHQKAAERGWTFDHVADLARVLRLPGTVNHKLEYAAPMPVELVHEDECRYLLADFSDLLPQDVFDDVPLLAPEEGSGSLPADVVTQIVDVFRSVSRQGRRHHLALCIAGWLANNGVSEAEAINVVSQVSVSGGDNGTRERISTVRDTYARLRTGKRPLGWTGLRQLVGSEQLRTLDAALKGAIRSGDTKPNGPDDTTGTTAQPSFQLTDMGNAERLVLEHGTDLRYCYRFGKWLVWDGVRFITDDGDAIMRRAKATVRNIHHSAGNEHDDKHRSEISGHAKASERTQRLTSMMYLAQSEPGIPIRPEALDSDPWLLACQNGTLDLRTGMLRPPDRADLITKLAPVFYDPNAGCPTFLAFVDRIMDGKEEMIHFLQRLIGYSLTGLTTERIIILLYGTGKNGKTKLLEVLRAMLGDYAMRTPTETLMVRSHSVIPNDVARLKGARFVSASESEEGRRLAEAKIKDLTGGDTISARFMRGEFFDFQPSCKLWLSSNYKPVIRGTDDGIWDRIKLVPFPVRISDHEQDKHLLDKLIMELPGILAWAVRGCLAWQRVGLSEPDDVRNATRSYRAEMNRIGAFIKECCVLGVDKHVSAHVIYQAYETWCQQNGEKIETKTMLGKQLSDLKLTRDQIGANRIRSWRGIGISTDFESGNERVLEKRTCLNTNIEIVPAMPAFMGERENTRSNAFMTENTFTERERQDMV